MATSLSQRLLVPLFIKLLGWLVVGLFHLARWLPERFTASIAVPIGGLIRNREKRRILDQVEQALGPFAGPDDEDRFWKRHCDHVGRCVFEGFQLTWSSDEEVLDQIELVGEEHLRHALEGGRGAVLFLNHLGNPGALVGGIGVRGFVSAFAGNRIEAGMAGRIWPLTGIENLVQRMFRRGRVERVLLGDSLPKRMSEVLKGNGLFGLFVDYPVNWKSLEPIPFDHCDLRLSLGPAILAIRHRVPVLSVTAVRTGINRHRLFVSPIHAPDSAKGMDAAAGLITAAIGQMLVHLRDNPDQWWPWNHAPFTPSSARHD